MLVPFCWLTCNTSILSRLVFFESLLLLFFKKNRAVYFHFSLYYPFFLFLPIILVFYSFSLSLLTCLLYVLYEDIKDACLSQISLVNLYLGICPSLMCSMLDENKNRTNS
jgi:hypothetical protein